ncbi:MAG TPA: hypothetical protein VMZ31_17155 [Phycisphaerae bacterium]|nr:hypothetical protein [Phycisphaerae bacterium]
MTRTVAKPRQPIWAWILLLIAVLLAGCQDVDWRWERNWWRRPSQAIQPAQNPPPPATRPQLTEPSYGPAEPAQTQYGLYQIHLLNEPGQTVSPGEIKQFHLAHAPAQPAARVLEILYPCIGGGGEDLPYLVFQDRTAWAAAGEFVPLLDTTSIDKEPPESLTSTRAAFARALGMYYVRWRPAGRVDAEGLKRVVELLDNVAQAPDADSQTGWAAGILACHIQSQVFFDFEAARHAARMGERHAMAGSFEQLVSIYQQADLLRQQGLDERARPLFRQIVEQFQAYQNTLLYHRAIRLTQTP